jgi:hypothetical protein
MGAMLILNILYMRRAIAEVKQRWSVIGWVTKMYLELLRASQGTLSRWPRLYLQSLEPHLGVVGYDSFSLCVIHKEGLCRSSGDINRLMTMTMMMMMIMMILHNVQSTAYQTIHFRLGSYFNGISANIVQHLRYSSETPVFSTLPFFYAWRWRRLQLTALTPGMVSDRVILTLFEFRIKQEIVWECSVDRKLLT